MDGLVYRRPYCRSDLENKCSRNRKVRNCRGREIQKSSAINLLKRVRLSVRMKVSMSIQIKGMMVCIAFTLLSTGERESITACSGWRSEGRGLRQTATDMARPRPLTKSPMGYGHSRNGASRHSKWIDETYQGSIIPRIYCTNET